MGRRQYQHKYASKTTHTHHTGHASPASTSRKLGKDSCNNAIDAEHSRLVLDKLTRATTLDGVIAEQLTQHNLDEAAWESELARCRRRIADHEAKSYRKRSGGGGQTRSDSITDKADYAHHLGSELAALRWLVEEDGLQRDRLSARARLLARQRTCLSWLTLQAQRHGDLREQRRMEQKMKALEARLRENTIATSTGARRDKAREAELATAQAKRRIRVRFFGAVSDVAL